MQEQTKRGPGRPRKDERRQHIDITLSQDIIDFIDWAKSPTDSRSAFIESWMKIYPLYPEWTKKTEEA